MKPKRKRIVTRESIIKLLAKIYDVAYYIAQKYYIKANEVIEEAKIYLKLYTLGFKSA